MDTAVKERTILLHANGSKERTGCILDLKVVSEFSFKELIGLQTNGDRKEEKALQRGKKKMIMYVYMHVCVCWVSERGC